MSGKIWEVQGPAREIKQGREGKKAMKFAISSKLLLWGTGA